MLGGIGLPELLIILAVVLLIFGVGRISRVGGELGKGVSAFRDGLREGQDETEEKLPEATTAEKKPVE